MRDESGKDNRKERKELKSLNSGRAIKSPSGRWNSAPMITTSNPPAARFKTALELVSTAFTSPETKADAASDPNPHVDDLDVETVLAVEALLDADPKHRRIFAAGAVGDAEIGERLRLGRADTEENEKNGYAKSPCTE